jgi:predicted Ser/Thr protein kinase/tetratricopeptide (TPR) repeat protein
VKCVCPTCGENVDGLSDADSGSAVCPRCHSSFAQEDSTVIDADAARRAYLETAAPGSPPAAAADGEPARVEIPGYDVLGFVAKGGMGYLLRARHRALGRIVAIKVPLAGQMSRRGSRERFLREARSAAVLRHPNICPIYEVGENPDNPFIVMGFIEGRTLREWARATHPAPRQCAELLAALARGVHYAHQHGVVHRDIKPGNVLVENESGMPILTDFGLAKQVADSDPQLTRQGQVMGTPAYMSPEQAAGRTDLIGPATDVYGLGAILFDLLCDRPPFLGSAGEILGRVQTEEVPSPRRFAPRVPRDLATICLKAMRKELPLRYATAGQLAEDLDRFCQGRPILAKPVGLARRLGKRIRRQPAVAATILAVLVTCGALVGYFASRLVRAHQASSLAQAFDAGLAAPDWDVRKLADMESLADRLVKLDPAQGRDAPDRLYAALARSAEDILRRPALAEADLAQFEARLALLEGRRGDLVPALRQSWAKRQRVWQPIFDLKPPMDSVSAVFGRLKLQGDSARLLPPAGGAAGKTPSVATQIPSTGNVRLHAVFAGNWPAARRIGLQLNLAKKQGYTLAMCSLPPGPEANAPEPAVPLTAIASARGSYSLCILRNDIVIREAMIPAADVPAGPLRLTGSRELNRLTFQVNDLPPIVTEDIFPLGGGQEAGVLGLLWPAEAGLEGLWAFRQAAPAEPSPLERGDQLYGEGRFVEALPCYRDQQIRARDVQTSQEARHKEAMCLLALNRPDDAAAVLEPLAAEEGQRWPPLAGCQLWQLRLQQGRLPDAEAIFDSLAGRFRFEDLAVAVPRKLADQILRSYQIATSGIGLFQVGPREVRGAERMVAVSELLYGASTAFWKWDLVRAYHAAGMIPKAERAAMETLALLTDERIEARQIRDDPNGQGPRDPHQLLIDVMEEAAWLACLQGRPDEGIRVINRRLCPGGRYDPDTYPRGLLPLLVARCRCHAAAGHADLAERDLQTFFRKATKDDVAYAYWASACLLQGMMLQDRGDAAGAAGAWRLGLPAPAGRLSGSGACYAAILSAFTGEPMGFEFLDVTTRALKGMPGGIARMAAAATRILDEETVVKCSRSAWTSDRGRQLARQIAFRQVSLPVLTSHSVAVLLVGFVRECAMEGRLSPQEEEMFFRMGLDGFSAFQARKFGASSFLMLVLAWSGSSGPLGWGGVAPTLDPPIRGPLAYGMGHRYLRLNKPKEAADLFRAALADASEDSPLRRLAQASLDKLKEP